jgi:hypothetical protein
MFMIRLQVQQNRTGVTRGRSPIEAGSGLKPKRYRTIIDQSHLHIGAKSACLNSWELFVATGDQPVEKG